MVSITTRSRAHENTEPETHHYTLQMFNAQLLSEKLECICCTFIHTALHHFRECLHSSLLRTLEANLRQEGTHNNLQGAPSGHVVVLWRAGGRLAATSTLKKGPIRTAMKIILMMFKSNLVSTNVWFRVRFTRDYHIQHMTGLRKSNISK